MYSVYKHWGKNGELLYIGCTTNLINRTLAHKPKKWFKDIDKITHEEFSDRKAALAEEKRLIWEERPKYNTMHHPDKEYITKPLPKPLSIMSETGGFSLEYIRYYLSVECFKEGNVRAWAIKNKMSHSYVSDVVRGGRKPSKKLLDKLGFKIRYRYKKLESMS